MQDAHIIGKFPALLYKTPNKKYITKKLDEKVD